MVVMAQQVLLIPSLQLPVAVGAVVLLRVERVAQVVVLAVGVYHMMVGREMLVVTPLSKDMLVRVVHLQVLVPQQVVVVGQVLLDQTTMVVRVQPTHIEQDQMLPMLVVVVVLPVVQVDQVAVVMLVPLER
jgi:hypothetical protein